MKDFQNMNCRGCDFADPKTVGTGEPCCTYPGKLEVVSGRCQQRRPMAQGQDKEATR